MSAEGKLGEIITSNPEWSLLTGKKKVSAWIFLAKINWAKDASDPREERKRSG